MPTPQKTPNTIEGQWAPVQESAPSSAWTPVQGASSSGNTPPAPQPTMLQRIGSGALDLVKGVGEGALHTVAGTDDWATKHLPTWFTTPIGQTPNAENQAKARAYTQNLETPTSTMQKIGKGTEQAAEFLIPGDAEEAAAAHLTPILKKIPGIAKAAPTVAKMGASAVGAGLVNKAQGGTFAGGAEMGAAGSALGAGLKKIAPKLAESALNVRGIDRGHGATPGQAILNDTSGFTPARVAETGRQSIDDLEAESGNLLNNAPGQVSLTPARGVLSEFADRAIAENHKGTIKDLGTLTDQLHNYAGATEDADKAIPDLIHPAQAGALKRGLSNAVTSWNPATANSTMTSAGKMAHHSLGESIADVVPEIQPLNQRIQSLMPVVRRATAEELNAGPAQRLIGRFKAHTGALAAGALAYQHGGMPAAAATFGGTELMASPETWLAAARGANSPFTGKFVLPAAQGAAMQFGRKDTPFVNPIP